MGLDNIPHRYACERLGTAVKVDILDKDGVAIVDEETGLPQKRIDCRETQAQGKCPYLISLSKTDLQDGSVTGIFGTDCWYRGTYGNYLIEALELPDFEYSFYGQRGWYIQVTIILPCLSRRHGKSHDRNGNSNQRRRELGHRGQVRHLVVALGSQ